MSEYTTIKYSKAIVECCNEDYDETVCYDVGVGKSLDDVRDLVRSALNSGCRVVRVVLVIEQINNYIYTDKLATDGTLII